MNNAFVKKKAVQKDSLFSFIKKLITVSFLLCLL
jgi:hypothetical protein